MVDLGRSLQGPAGTWAGACRGLQGPGRGLAGAWQGSPLPGAEAWRGLQGPAGAWAWQGPAGARRRLAKILKTV